MNFSRSLASAATALRAPLRAPSFFAHHFATFFATFFALGALFLAPAAHAQTAPVTAAAAWARPTVQGQLASGAFMRLTAREPVALVGAETPLAARAELHEMKMEGDVMRMREIASLDLPVGRPMMLGPGGYHIMLQGLKAPLKPDMRIPLTLMFRDASGHTSKLELTVPVLAHAPDEGGAKKP
ncbi:MAG TPA: copper chaperone PCu(A)C [Ramlibacter sp.]|uniref:copper chaperone PCu(A)C n=1 Tax=Ramlibacter sp. TaxID=1917967 RepID=UPI002B975436|nr:copper chaperone PCu(A)C [Ramlibacter sp.]HVZ43783.1 copper chaperone PCu(A)C [Ramlibacter sp.]